MQQSFHSKLLGRARIAGERLSPDEVAQISDKMQGILVRQRVIRLIDTADEAAPELANSDWKSPEVAAAQIGLKKATETVQRATVGATRAEQVLAEIERKHNAAKDRATSLSAAREPYALKSTFPR